MGRRRNRLEKERGKELLEALIAMNAARGRGRPKRGDRMVAYRKIAEAFGVSVQTIKTWGMRGVPEARLAHIQHLVQQGPLPKEPFESQPELFRAMKLLERVYELTDRGRTARWRELVLYLEGMLTVVEAEALGRRRAGGD